MGFIDLEKAYDSVNITFKLNFSFCMCYVLSFLYFSFILCYCKIVSCFVVGFVNHVLSLGLVFFCLFI